MNSLGVEIVDVSLPHTDYAIAAYYILAAAEASYRRSLGIMERLAPGGLDVAASLNNLAEVAHSRGDLAAAEELHHQGLDITERLVRTAAQVAKRVRRRR